VYDFLNQECSDELNLLRHYFSAFAIKDITTERPLRDTEKDLQWFTFTGTKVNRTIQLLLNIAGIKNTLDDSNSSFLLEMSKQDFLKRWKSLPKPLVDIDSYLYELLEEHPAIMEFSKWGIHLPKNYQVRLIKSKYFAIEQTKYFLETMQLVENK
jgi:ATP-dependent Lhr-like helicase